MNANLLMESVDSHRTVITCMYRSNGTVAILHKGMLNTVGCDCKKGPRPERNSNLPRTVSGRPNSKQSAQLNTRVELNSGPSYTPYDATNETLNLQIIPFRCDGTCSQCKTHTHTHTPQGKWEMRTKFLPMCLEGKYRVGHEDFKIQLLLKWIVEKQYVNAQRNCD